MKNSFLVGVLVGLIVNVIIWTVFYQNLLKTEAGQGFFFLMLFLICLIGGYLSQHKKSC